MIRIAVCDDNALAAEQIQKILSQECRHFWEECRIEVFADAVTLVEADRENRFDVLFLDICMPEMDGFQLAEKVRKNSSKRFLIFVTSQDDLVYQVFTYEPFDFIRKRSEELMRQDIAEVLARLSAQFVQEEVLVLEGAYHIREKIRIREIRYLWSQKNYLLYMLENNRQVRVRGTMAEAQRALEQKGFLRIHKSLLVNMRYIERIDYQQNRLEIIGGEYLEIGSKYKGEIGDRYLDYLKGGDAG